MAANPDHFDQDTLAAVAHLMLRARRIVEGVRAGIHRSPMHGASVEFAEHKEYTAGDELRHIDWKLFGKFDKYYVKRFEEETNLLTYFLLDTSASMGYGGTSTPRRSFWDLFSRDRKARGDGWSREGRRSGWLRDGWRNGRPRDGSGKPGDGSLDGNADDNSLEVYQTKHEYAMLLVAALSYLLVGQGDSVGLYTFGQGDSRYVPPRAQTGHLTPLLGTLAGVVPSGSGNIAAALTDFAPRVRRRSLIILVSDLLEDPEEVLRTMKALRTRRNDVVVFHVMHSDELLFPYSDVSRFEDPEDRQQELIADPREIREGYLEELESFLTLVRRRCLEARIDYRLFNTATPVASALADFLAGRMVPGKRLQSAGRW